MSVVATLDHVVINARDDLAGAASLFGRLGFVLTPRGEHTLGTVNHLAMFGTDYLELLAAPPGRGDLSPMTAPPGLYGVAFGTEDAAATYAGVIEAGVAAQPPLSFSRPVDGPDGPRDAAFQIVRLESFPGGHGFFCHHLTPELVWRDEVRRHPNGVVGIDGVVIAARNPAAVGAFLGDLFGADSVAGTEGGVRLACGLSRVEVLAPSVAAERLGEAVSWPDGQEAVMAGLALRVVARARTGEALRIGGVPVREDAGGRLVVPAAAALGVVLMFGD